jgi:peptide-methionine (S)-S-oxide reductase
MKMIPPRIFATAVLAIFAGACGGGPKSAAVLQAENDGSPLRGREKEMLKKIEKSEDEWKALLTPAALDFKPSGLTGEETKVETQTATFAAGCFWGIEDNFRKVRGVVSTRVGYTGGQTRNPTYREVCSNSTGHAESVEIIFDPAVVSYEDLLDRFFILHDPTQVNRQGPDVGSQYRSAVFYHNDAQKQAALKAIARLNQSGKFDRPIATVVLPATDFYAAEDYHQQYYQKLRQGR